MEAPLSSRWQRLSLLTVSISGLRKNESGLHGRIPIPSSQTTQKREPGLPGLSYQKVHQEDVLSLILYMIWLGKEGSQSSMNILGTKPSVVMGPWHYVLWGHDNLFTHTPTWMVPAMNTIFSAIYKSCGGKQCIFLAGDVLLTTLAQACNGLPAHDLKLYCFPCCPMLYLCLLSL